LEWNTIQDSTDLFSNRYTCIFISWTIISFRDIHWHGGTCIIETKHKVDVSFTLVNPRPLYTWHVWHCATKHTETSQWNLFATAQTRLQSKPYHFPASVRSTRFYVEIRDVFSYIYFPVYHLLLINNITITFYHPLECKTWQSCYCFVHLRSTINGWPSPLITWRI
jgi:hypothetical protein